MLREGTKERVKADRVRLSQCIAVLQMQGLESKACNKVVPGGRNKENVLDSVFLGIN